jgi:hypothetical protein
VACARAGNRQERRKLDAAPGDASRPHMEGAFTSFIPSKTLSCDNSVPRLCRPGESTLHALNTVGARKDTRDASRMARSTKRQKKDEFFEDDDLEQPDFADSDESQTSEDESAEDQETAEEKRLRLAHAYLDRIRQVNQDEEDVDGDLTEKVRGGASSIGLTVNLTANLLACSLTPCSCGPMRSSPWAI